MSKANILQLGVFFMSGLLIACEEDEGMQTEVSRLPSEVGIETSAIHEFLRTPEGLVISRLTEEGVDESTYFKDWVFNFEIEGAVRASKDEQTISGNYSVFKDDGKYELMMRFPSIGEFHELNDDWYFISMDQGRIKFDDAGDSLEFVKQDLNKN